MFGRKKEHHIQPVHEVETKGSHRPFARHRKTSFLTVVFTLAAFVLFLLVGLSLPKLKPVYLLEIRSIVQPGQPATSIASLIRVGVWGICATSALNAPTLLDNKGICYNFKDIGYKIPPSLLELAGVSSTLVDAFVKGILVLLVLHVVCAGLSGLVLIPSIFLGVHTMAITALVLCIITILVSSVTLAVDLALVIIAKQKIKELPGGIALDVNWGNGTWMVLAGLVCTWIALIFLSARACYCCGVRRKRGENARY